MNLKKRRKHICFIKDCDSIYLYISTFKKHLQLVHKQEYQIIKNYYGKVSLLSIIQQIHKNTGNFNFLKVNQKYKNINSLIIENPINISIIIDNNIKEFQLQKVHNILINGNSISNKGNTSYSNSYCCNNSNVNDGNHYLNFNSNALLFPLNFNQYLFSHSINNLHYLLLLQYNTMITNLNNNINNNSINSNIDHGFFLHYLFGSSNNNEDSRCSNNNNNASFIKN